MTPERLYSFVNRKDLSKGLIPNGWNPHKKIVPAFDPDMKTPEFVREAFNFGDDIVFVEIVDGFKSLFSPRRTGPKKEFQGCYASSNYIPAWALRQVL